MRQIICAILVLCTAGCVSIPNSPSPRFYMLQPLEDGQVSRKFDNVRNLVIEIGPVRIPEYQDRPQIVTVNKDKTLAFAQFDRWGENLDIALTRVINENLTMMLPGASLRMFPCALEIPVKYQVLIDVFELRSELGKEMFFAAQWSIIEVRRKKMRYAKRSEFRLPVDPQNYSGLAEALSAACASLSGEIADKVAALAVVSKAGTEAPKTRRFPPAE